MHTSLKKSEVNRMNMASESCTGWISYQLVGTREEAKKETGDILILLHMRDIFCQSYA